MNFGVRGGWVGGEIRRASHALLWLHHCPSRSLSNGGMRATRLWNERGSKNQIINLSDIWMSGHIIIVRSMLGSWWLVMFAAGIFHLVDGFQSTVALWTYLSDSLWGLGWSRNYYHPKKSNKFLGIMAYFQSIVARAPHSKLVDSQLSLIWPWKSTTHGIPWSSAGMLWISNPWTDQMGEWFFEQLN